jgi:hypothetical protein
VSPSDRAFAIAAVSRGLDTRERAEEVVRALGLNDRDAVEVVRKALIAERAGVCAECEFGSGL